MLQSVAHEFLNILMNKTSWQILTEYEWQQLYFTKRESKVGREVIWKSPSGQATEYTRARIWTKSNPVSSTFTWSFWALSDRLKKQKVRI